ncbi:MAG: hypothetical protein KBH45_16755, partial [Verrucomicrobia bacterium]|nr:hypothetical protein [Verrucomicrobiota bacterium]
PDRCAVFPRVGDDCWRAFASVDTNELIMNLKLVNRMKKTIKRVVATAPAALKSAPAKTAVKTTSAAGSSVTAASPITIEAKIDVGFGNNLFVRGQGSGLSWDHGIPLECVDSQTWRLIVPAKDKVQFKLLINDSVWAKGEDVVVTPGKRVELVPAF